jgi:hypothetical protein
LKKLLIAAVATAAIATSAHATITVDGVLDADYGAPTAQVSFDSGAAEGNFQSPGSASDNVAYSIYLHDEGGTLYGFLQAAGPTNGLNFANLYFDIDPATYDGSNLGFEIGNNDAFIPGVSGSVTPLSGMTYALGTNSFEFSISNSYFTSPIAGLSYNAGQVFAAPGGEVTLRLSQSLGYSVAGGDSYGADRLGSVTLEGGVPEPASWSMMILGFLGAGATLRGARRKDPLAV